MPGPGGWTPWVPGTQILFLLMALVGSWTFHGIRRLQRSGFLLCYMWLVVSMRVAATDLDARSPVRDLTLSGTKMPPYMMFREDTGTAIDLLQRIEFHQANAAPAIGPGDLPFDPAQGGQQHVDHELDVLLAFPGNRQLAFYRADPGGTLEFHLDLTVTTSLADIRQRLHQTWPDLPQATWQLVSLDDTWTSSPFAPPGAISFLVWVTSDLLTPDGSIIAMVESQKWNLATGAFEATYAPITLPSSVTLPQLMALLGLANWCRSTPCTARQNNLEMLWRRDTVLWDAAYIVVTTVTEPAHLRTILDTPAGSHPISRQTIPESFADLALLNARYAWPGLAQDVAYSAQAMQVSFSIQARSIYFLTGMHRLQQRELAVAELQAGPVFFRSYQHSAPRGPFGLYYKTFWILTWSHLTPCGNYLGSMTPFVSCVSLRVGTTYPLSAVANDPLQTMCCYSLASRCQLPLPHSDPFTGFGWFLVNSKDYVYLHTTCHFFLLISKTSVTSA